MKVYAATDIGRVRPINEDSYYAPKPGERFCAVADGMGGHNAGEVASAMAVRVLEEEMRAPTQPTEEALRRAVERANARDLTAPRKEREGCPGMGTTITALCMEGNIAHIAQVGDSRAYLIRNRAILQVTTDHTLVEEMVLSGLITPSEALNHPKRNYITRALGTAETVEVDLLRLDTRPDDVFLLCSDGLSNCPERARDARHHAQRHAHGATRSPRSSSAPCTAADTTTSPSSWSPARRRRNDRTRALRALRDPGRRRHRRHGRGLPRLGQNETSAPSPSRCCGRNTSRTRNSCAVSAARPRPRPRCRTKTSSTFWTSARTTTCAISSWSMSPARRSRSSSARRGRIAPETAVRMVIRILAAVDHAHKNGIVHRDIKPQNILVDAKGKVKVADFGIARLKTAQTTRVDDKQNSALGSVHYFSPEQASGEVADEKSDLYSVGVVLYEMLTGQVPFDGDTAVSVALKHVSEEPRSMRELNPAISRALDEVVMRALAKDSARRYQTAAEFAGDLRKAVVHPRGGFVAYPVSREEQERQREEKRRQAARRKRRLRRASFFAAIAVGVAIVGALVWYFAAVYNMESVPLTIGSEEAAATGVIAQRGFVPVVEYAYSEEYPQGLVHGAIRERGRKAPSRHGDLHHRQRRQPVGLSRGHDRLDAGTGL